MDMMSDVAAMVMDMQAARLAQSYGASIARAAMDAQEQQAQQLLEMLPQQSAVPKGQYIDVYA